MMKLNHIAALALLVPLASCLPALKVQEPRKDMPAVFAGAGTDTTTLATRRWREFFRDPYLVALVDSALANNQELNILLQEVAIANNEVRARKGEYLPFVDLEAGGSAEKPGRYTRDGVVEHSLEIDDGKEFPEPLTNLVVGARASWEVDIWRKLRNAKKAAALRYLATAEGRNFAVTRLVSEIARSYYELLALDKQLDILRSNIGIQQDALEIVRLEKQSAKVTELAVRRFEAEVLKNKSLQFSLQQRIVETENRINYLVGRYPRPIPRDPGAFDRLALDSAFTGVPSQLLANRPDIRQAELELAAARLDVKVARAEFFPSLRITAGVGLEAFDASRLVQTPQSLLYSAAGGLVAPLINRNAIKAAYLNANARQIQAVYGYDRTLLNAYIEVANQVAGISNLRNSYELRAKQVEALSSSITISSNLFRSARADYMEVLLTQRDALDSKFELVETRMLQLNAVVGLYQALGGGWN